MRYYNRDARTSACRLIFELRKKTGDERKEDDLIFRRIEVRSVGEILFLMRERWTNFPFPLFLRV